MSVITSWPAVPSRISIVWSYLKRAGPGGVNAEEFRCLFSPRSLQAGQHDDEDERSGTSIADHVVNEMRNLGLVQSGMDGSFALAPGAPNGDEGVLLTFLERRLLDPGEAELCGQKAFPLALAWFLVQDPAIPLSWGQNYSGQVQDDCGRESGSFELTNHSAFEQFVYWARYLGFAWRLETLGVNVVFPDPTQGITRYLPAVTDAGRRPIRDVMSALALRLPVLEGGTARAEIESRLPAAKRLLDGYLSRSTSLALERLELLGRIVLERVADAPAVSLDRATGPRAVSHITRRNGG